MKDKEHKYPPEFEKLYIEMPEDELKKLTYVGYLQIKNRFVQLMKIVIEAQRKKNSSDM